MVFQRLRLVPVLPLLARPGQRRIQRHAINPGANEGFPPESWNGIPDLRRDFLKQILSIVGVEAVSMNNFEAILCDGSTSRPKSDSVSLPPLSGLTFAPLVSESRAFLTNCFEESQG